MKAENISIIRCGDGFSKAVFSYKGHSLEVSFENTSSKEDVAALIKDRIEKWEEAWAEDNFNALQEEFGGKDLEL